MNLDLPPRRELPGDAEARIRATVQRCTGRRAKPARRVVLVAAAVVLLVVGTVSVARFTQPSPAAGGLAAPDVQRCWLAVQSAGKTAQVPPVAQWRVVYSDKNGDGSVIALHANGKGFFCELTPTTVTLSDPGATPTYAPGSHTALLLFTATGLVAGVTDPSIPNLDLYDGDLGVSMSRVAPTGQFSAFTAKDPTKTHLSAWPRADAKEPGIAYVGQRVPLPAPPAPLLTVQGDVADRASPAGQALGQCLDGAPDKLPDAAAYEPGAMLVDGPYQVVLGKSGLHAVACVSQPDPKNPANTVHRLYHDTFIGQSIPVRRLAVDGLGVDGAHVPFVGIVPPDTQTMVADFTTGLLEHPQVANGTFAIWLPKGARSPAPNGLVSVRADDAAGKSLFNGWIPLK